MQSTVYCSKKADKWNGLPLSLRTETHIEVFYLFTVCYYSNDIGLCFACRNKRKNLDLDWKLFVLRHSYESRNCMTSGLLILVIFGLLYQTLLSNLVHFDTSLAYPFSDKVLLPYVIWCKILRYLEVECFSKHFYTIGSRCHPL